jgi:asparagine synthase (glutamine-hydrolysing)
VSGLAQTAQTAQEAWIDPLAPRALRLGERVEADAFGARPLFWARAPSGVLIGGDWHRLRQALGPPFSIDATALHGYMCLSHVPTPLTLDPRVRTLPAGCHLTVSAAGDPIITRPNPWGEAPQQLEDEAEAVAAFAPLLRAAIGRALDRCRGLTLGVALSGGLDSSLVAALLREAGATAKLYALDFGPPYDEELAHAQAVADHLGWPLHTVRARGKEVRAALPIVAASLQQPFGDGVVVPWYLLAKAMAGDGVQAMWTGEFGDQLFGGWANKPMIAASLYDAPDAPDAPDALDTSDKAQREVHTYLHTYHRFWGLSASLYTPALHNHLTSLGVIGDEGRWVRDALHSPHASTVLHRLRAANLSLKGAQNIAPRLSQAALAAGVEAISPFMDAPLTHHTFRLSPSLLLRGACEKYLLKRIASPLLPDPIVWREKRGMGAPTTAWCQAPSWRRLPGPLWSLTRRALSPKRLTAQNLLNPSFIQALRRNEPGAADPQRPRRQGERLWLLLMWMTWADAHLNPTPTLS